MTGVEWRPDYEILGMSLFGPPPVGVVHLKWEPRLVIVYGRNGVGKTAILDGISNALEGSRHRRTGQALRVKGRSRPTGEWLHVHLTEDATPIAWDSESFTGRLADYIAGNDLDQDDVVWRGDDIRDLVMDRLRNPKEAFLPVRLSEDAMDELVCQMCFSIRTDTHGGPDAVYASAVLSEEARHLNEHVRSVENDVRRAHTSKGLYQDGWESFRHPDHGLSGSAVAGVHVLPFLEPRPSWVPVPIARLDDEGRAPLVYPPDRPEVFSVSDGDPDQLTNNRLIGRGGMLDKVEEDGDMLIEISEEFSSQLAELEDRANSNYGDLLLGAPRLRLSRTEPDRWFEGKVASWQALDRPTGNWVPVGMLSTAQLRWANTAIQFALKSFGGHRAMVIDGPEDALHPQALAHLMEDLVATSKSFGPIYVASHSPQALATKGAHLLHVRRDIDGLAEVVELDDELRDDIELTAEKLGLLLSDMIQLYRVFLVVEGRHDSEILQATLGHDLDKAQVHILHMSGTYNLLDVAGSEFLFKFTDASVVVATDGTDPKGLPAVWKSAQSLAMDGKRKAAIGLLSRSEKNNRLTPEERKVLEFCKNAVSQGVPDRIELVGLSKPDIIQYLNADHFVPGKTWDRLWQEYMAYKHDASHRKKFKGWLGDVGETKPKRGALGPLAKLDFADAIPKDFTDLLATCRRLAGL